MIIDVDAILFDSDGVLVDSHAAVEAAWRQLAQEFDLEIDLLLGELAGVRAIDTLRNHLQPERLTAAVDRLEQLELDLASRTGALPGAVEITASLPRGSWTIVTSGSRRLASARWAAAGVTVPDVTVTAESVTRGKPHPEPFLAAANALGVHPSRCLVFEDSASGAQAADAAGAQVAAVGSAPWTIEACVRIRDFVDISVEPTSDRTIRLSFPAPGA
ncbi:MAG: HAD-IA family hydrolase [Acidimicrobiales bacterium]